MSKLELFVDLAAKAFNINLAEEVVCGEFAACLRHARSKLL